MQKLYDNINPSTILHQSQQILEWELTQQAQRSRSVIGDPPVSKNMGKYRFFSRLAHQFQALVNLPSIQLPASKKLSAPEPSNPCRKKSPKISCMRFSDDPNSSSMYERRAGFAVREGICERVLQIGSRMRYIWVYLSMNINALGTL